MTSSSPVSSHTNNIVAHGRVDFVNSSRRESFSFQIEPKHSLENGKDLNLSYRPPALLEAAQTRYIGAFKNGSVASSLLTVVSTELVLHFSESRSSALAILSHLSFTFNLSAAFSGLLLSNKIGSLNEGLARRDAPEPQSGYIATGSGSGSLLRWYGLRRRWRLLMVHWAMCFLFGVGCLFAQIMVHASTVETTPITIATACVLGFAALPFAFAFRLIIN
ncbi:hypothetical protein AAF712_016476 [Marasmius tenuissimus]|uniref:Uncharacterized protein n=1 Tax=Marasmius tenuissimus TaxID=585030 RepID=A0ABR2Z7K2_9AGAR